MPPISLMLPNLRSQVIFSIRRLPSLFGLSLGPLLEVLFESSFRSSFRSSHDSFASNGSMKPFDSHTEE